MSNLGSLVVSLEANIVKFQSDLGKAAAIAEQRAAQMDRTFSMVKNSLATIGVAVGFGIVFDKIKGQIEGAIDTAAGLQQLSERTGAAVEALSSLSLVAKLSGTGTDQLAVGLQKLSKSMIDAENGGTKTSASFNAIGISMADLQGKKPDQVFQMVAKSLADYQDGAEKVVIVQNLLGKSGADLLPVMKDLADVGDLQATVTGAQAAQADELEKNLVRLHLSTDALFQKISLQLVPVFNAVVKTFLDTANGTDGIRGSIDKLSADNSIRTWAENTVKALGNVTDAWQGMSRAYETTELKLHAGIEAFKAFESLNFSKALAIKAQANKDSAAIWAQPYFSQTLRTNLAATHYVGTFDNGEGQDGAKPIIPIAGLGNANAYKGPKDDPARAYMEGQLKAQDALIAAEKTQLATREQMLDFYRGLDLFTLRDTEEKKQQLIADNLVTTQAAYNKEVAAVKDYIAHADTQQNKQQGQNQLADVIRKRAAAEVEANKQISDSQNKLLQVMVQFDNATVEGQRQADKSNAAARFQIDLLGQNTLAVQQQLAAKQIQLALDERIYQLKKLDPTVDTSKAIAAAAIQQAQAQALITESYNKQRDAIFGANEALRKYQEDAGNKAAQIESALMNAFKGAEDAAVSFVTTSKGSIKSLVDSVVADITRMIIKEQESKILGGLSSGGGMMGLLGSLIGAVSGTSGMASVASGMGGDSLDNFIGLAGLAGAKASGGPVMGGSSYLVGENGPEIFKPSASGTIIPNGAIGGAGGQPTINQTIVFNHTGQVDPRTKTQLAAAALQGMRQGQRNL